MRTSQRGIDLIKSFEGCRLKAYRDIGGTLTIGYGHTQNVYDGMTITQEEADSMLVYDLMKYEDKINKYYPTYYFNQNQFDALVSFCYNIGNIDELTNRGLLSISKIPETMALYNKCKGKTVQGLVNRRNKEIELFNTPLVAPEVPQKTNEEVAREVVKGIWGKGAERKRLLTEAGYDYNAVQSIVNSFYSTNKKTNEEVALEVIKGKWGNGSERKRRLTEAGYDYQTIRKIVNSILYH